MIQESRAFGLPKTERRKEVYSTVKAPGNIRWWSHCNNITNNVCEWKSSAAVHQRKHNEKNNGLSYAKASLLLRAKKFINKGCLLCIFLWNLGVEPANYSPSVVVTHGSEDCIAKLQVAILRSGEIFFKIHEVSIIQHYSGWLYRIVQKFPGMLNVSNSA